MTLLPRLLLQLYPPSFRRRFAPEWAEIVGWHRRALEGASLAGVRLALVLVTDTLTALPGAYLAAMGLGSHARGSGSDGGPGRDVRHAVRTLLRNPTFTWAAVVSIALGIGANTATFSVVDAVLLRPLPYAQPDRLAIVWNEFPGAGGSSGLRRLPLSGVEVASLRQEPDLFTGVEGIWATSASVIDREGRVAQISMGDVTPGFFALLGVEPALGRSFVRDGSEGPVPMGVVLSDEAWRNRYGADRSLVGRTIDLNGEPVPVIAVLPAGFTLFFPEDGAIPSHLDAFTALASDLTRLPPAQHFLRVVGRLRPDVDLERASIGVAAAADRARATYPELQDTGDRFTVRPLHADTVRTVRPILLTLLAAVGLFLLLAGANVASLVLARTLSRTRELAVRASLGASRAGLARLVAVESLLVTTLGAVLGVWLGRLGAQALWALRPEGIARAEMSGLDLRVLGFTVAVSVLAGVAFPLISLVAVRGVDAGLGLRGGTTLAGRTGRRVREWLTAGEVAVGLVLVAGSALMVRSVTSLGRESVGFDPAGALTFKVSLDLRRFPADSTRAQLADEMVRRLSALPGVRAAGATSHLPFASWANWAEAAPPEGTPEADRAKYFADLRSVTPGYLQAVGARLVAGRFFDDRDDAGGDPAVIIDETMARRLFPDLDPGEAVGRRVEPSRFHASQFEVTPATVVGVIRDIRDRTPARASTGQVFWPFAQSARWELTFFVRTEGDPTALSDAARRAVAAVDPRLDIAAVAPMTRYVRTATALTRFLALVGSVFSVLAVLMAAVGLYGVVAFVTVQRTHEFGLRSVLGATRRELLRDVLAQGLRVGATGVGVGLLASLALARFLRGLVYGVSAHDPATLIVVAALLLVVALLASLAPARRATRVDPMTALREV